ncbi:MAG: hypothetical protein ACPGQL_10685 [Thermoplasmatota archaeon]
MSLPHHARKNWALAAIAILVVSGTGMAGHLTPNTTTGTDAVVGGGDGNTASAAYSGVSAGRGNTASGLYSAVNGGQNGQALGDYSGVGSGRDNTASDAYAFVGGGNGGTAGDGNAMTTTGRYSVVMGGFGNTASNTYSTVLGGRENTASGVNAVVAAGFNNQASGTYSATIGGQDNTASGVFSVALGRDATAAHRGSFVFSDGSASNFASTADNQFLIDAAGGVGINKNNPATALDVAGTVTATAFAGDGSQLTGLPAGTGNTFDQDIVIGNADAADDDAIFFDQSGQSLHWDNTNDWFEFSNDLALNSDLFMEASGTDGDQHIYFANLGSNTGESISWDDAQERFESSDEWAIYGPIRSGCETDAPLGYNAFATCSIISPTSGDMGSRSDVYVEFDLEVGQQAYLSKELFMEGSSAGGADGDQVIYFYDTGNRAAEHIKWNDAGNRFEISDRLGLDAELMMSSGVADIDQTIYFADSGSLFGEALEWDDSEDRFEATDDLAVDRALRVGCMTEAVTGYNAFAGCGLDTPESGSMGNEGDLFVRYDHEVGNNLYLSQRLYMEGSSVAGGDTDQIIYFYNDGSRTAEDFRWDDSANEFAVSADLRLDGALDFLTGDITHTSTALTFDMGVSDDVEIGAAGAAGGVDFYIHDGGFCVHKDATCPDIRDGSAAFPDGGICVDNDASCLPPADGQITARSYNTGASDLAEVYPSNDLLLPGEVVALDPANPGGFKRAAPGDQVLRVVSTEPGLVLGAADGEALLEAFGLEIGDEGDEVDLPSAYLPGTYPIALSGRVPTLVNLEGGAILPGDAITLSSVPGVAKKAADGEPVLGHALAAFDGVGTTVEVFVRDAGDTAELEAKNAALQAQVDDLESRLATLEALLNG